MVTIYHFVFEIIKIVILACFYATLTLLLFKLVGRNAHSSWFAKASKKKLRFWFFSVLIISLGLFLFMFSYYGDHGLGDDARIPIGNRRAIQQVDARQAYIQDEGPIPMLTLDKFIVTDNYVYGLSGEEEDNYDGSYFVYDLKLNSVKTFTDQSFYLEYLKKLSLDNNTNYKNFDYYYSEYWDRFIFWLLP